jgi:hypothetical protein
MSPTSPAARAAVVGCKLAGIIESRVRRVGPFLPIIEQNKPQIFEQFDKSLNKKIFT